MSGQQIFGLVTGMLSGLALFMFGMNVMSDTLTQLAGGRLSSVIDRITEKRLAAWSFGTGLAIFVQSSVTTVMTVGLVNSGIMKVSQSLGVMIGANLGTTATAWLLSLNSLGGSFWLQLLKPSSFTPFLAIGSVVFLMFANDDKKKSIGTIVIGFSVMMIGMDMMSNSVAPLQDVPAFNKMMLSVSNPLIGVLVGVACTLMIQSSAAAIGILQALAMSLGVTFGMAIPIVCGAQLGTCLTAILASLQSNNNGKRAALIHLFYNLIRNSAFLVIFYLINMIVHFPFLQAETGAVGIAAFHTAINLLGSAVFIPFGGFLIPLVHKVLPYNDAEKQEQADTLTILNPIFLSNPAFAIDQVRTASTMLADAVQEYFDAYISSISDNSEEQTAKAKQLGAKASRYAAQLRKYCISISEQKMHDADARNLVFLNNAVNDYAEMTEKITNMLHSITGFRASGRSFSEEAEQDLRVFGSAAQEILEATVHDYTTRNTRLAETVQIYREIITDMHGKISKRNVRRLHSGECAQENNFVFSDLCAGYERIIDRCDSIASHILMFEMVEAQTPSKEQYDAIRALFTDKFQELDS
ncbi:MAG: Na/Pi cotransporter family protein [Lachnospiraceae bacterium]|nr:Na/Pi cotransporter family protein [Lachnospiraceae bacterium]